MKIFTTIVLIGICVLTSTAQRNGTAARQITTKDIRESLYGQKIEGIDSAFTAWAFSEEELIELDIIQVKSVRGRTVATVEIRTGDATGLVNVLNGINQNAMTLAGTMNVVYVNGEVTAIENVSVRLSQKPVIFRNVRPSTMQPQPVSSLVLNEAFHMPSNTKKWFPFTVNRTTRITGTFFAEGGGRNDIEGWIMSDIELINFRNNNQFRSFYRSGSVTIGSVDVVLSPGNYVIAFRNGAWIDSKTVKVSLSAQ